MEKNISWCPLPWKGVNIRNNGDYRVCCHANTSNGKGILRRADGVSYNAKNAADIREARNCSLLKEIRKSMLEGKRHDVCVRCNNEDDANIRSRRYYETQFWEKEFTLEQAQKISSPDGSIQQDEVAVGYYDIRFGNLCNLKCRMCGPTDSNHWHREHLETIDKSFQDTSGLVYLEKDEHDRVRIRGDNPYLWHENPEFWKQIENNLDGLRKIYLVGGEPLLIERHYDFLRKIIEAGRSNDVIVEYNSNITVIPPKALTLWKEFKEVKIGASIDGVGAINEYIRHPSKWSVTERNLDILDTAPGNLSVWIAATVQIYNIFHLPDFLRWKIERNFQKINVSKRMPFLTTHPLHSPLHFNIQALPHAAKIKAAEKFDHFFQDWFLPYVHDQHFSDEKKKNWVACMEALLSGYKKMMFQADHSAQLHKFLEVTRSMDQYRKESFSQTMPELAEYIISSLNKTGGAHELRTSF